MVNRQHGRKAASLGADGKPSCGTFNAFLWIAATALNFGLPLVSNNKKHFARVPGLDLRGY